MTWFPNKMCLGGLLVTAYQVRAEKDLSPSVQQILQRGDGFSDPCVIFYCPSFAQGDVEVRSHLHPRFRCKSSFGIGLKTVSPDACRVSVRALSRCRTRTRFPSRSSLLRESTDRLSAIRQCCRVFDLQATIELRKL